MPWIIWEIQFQGNLERDYMVTFQLHSDSRVAKIRIPKIHIPLKHVLLLIGNTVPSIAF